MNRIVIKFPTSCEGIILISSEDIKAHFEAIGKNVPFTFVGLPYVEIEGKSFEDMPLPRNELEA